MRPGCWNCIYKHLVAAQVIHEEEVPLGYPKHIRRVIGHLNEACTEALQFSRPLAETIRYYRLQIMDKLPNGAAYFPPYDDLLDYVEVALAASNSKLEVPAFPEDLLVKAIEG